MKVFPGTLLLKAQGLTLAERGQYYEAVFHLWGSETMGREEMEARIGVLSDALVKRLDVAQDGLFCLLWLDDEREHQTRLANKNSRNGTKGGRGRQAKATGFTTGKPNGKTTGKATPASASASDAASIAVPEPLKEVWEEFRAHRREIKKPMTPRSEGLLLKQIESWTPERAIAAIHHSIAGGWQGIFEATNGHAKPFSPDGRTKEQFEAVILEHKTRNNGVIFPDRLITEDREVGRWLKNGKQFLGQ